MKNIKKVFTNNGELNLEGAGTIATLDDLNFDICCGGEPIEETIQLADGIYRWIDLTFIDEDDFMGYSKIMSN